jgi:hypothetical protein
MQERALKHRECSRMCRVLRPRLVSAFLVWIPRFRTNRETASGIYITSGVTSGVTSGAMTLGCFLSKGHRHRSLRGAWANRL